MKPHSFIFSEEQKFTQWWIWLILIASYGFPVFTISQSKEFIGKTLMEQIQSTEIIVLSTIMFAVILLFLVIQLKTNITEEEIRVEFNPFTKKQFLWKDITKAEVLDYGFVGGWGIRLFTKYGTAYNIKGSIGLAIELKNGKKYLIGTQKGDLLKSSIQGLIK